MLRAQRVVASLGGPMLMSNLAMPDFLDPMHHEEASGRESYNLDGWMLSR